MKHYLFVIDNENCDYDGEEFIVGANNAKEARNIAMDMFGYARYLCELSEEEAEASGLDEY